MNLDERLEQVLQRVDAPAGFADRVMGRVAFAKRRRRGMLFSRIAAAAAVVLMLGVSGLHYMQERQEQKEGEEAKRQLMTALRITAQKSSLARHAVQESAELNGE